jgi:hypothetical protein
VRERARAREREREREREMICGRDALREYPLRSVA